MLETESHHSKLSKMWQRFRVKEKDQRAQTGTQTGTEPQRRKIYQTKSEIRKKRLHISN